MNQTEFDELIKRLNSETNWSYFGAFAGESAVLRSFVSDLNLTLSGTSDPNQPELLLFSRGGQCQRIESAVIQSLGHPAGEITRLYPGCNVHNHNALFGNGNRRSIFEYEQQRVVVVGLEHLNRDGWLRFVRCLNVWLATHPKKMLLVGESLTLPKEADDFLRSCATELRYPNLNERRDDVVFEIHMSARACDGGIDQFPLEAINLLLQEDWPGGIRDLDQVVRRVYRDVDSGGRINVAQVNACLKSHVEGGKRTRSTVEPLDLWNPILRLREDIDRLSTSLIGHPFFAQRAETSTQRPLGSGCPELDFFRLVSWAYMMFVECGGPNIASVLKLASGLQIQSYRIAEVGGTVGRLRTFLQHSLQYGSKSDQQTIELASRWFDEAVGRLQPLQHDYEVCIVTMLVEIRHALDDVHEFLRRLNEDEYKHTIIRQWKDRTENAWPKHEYDSVVRQALTSLGRQDLDPMAICKKLLPKMQERLKVVSRDHDPKKCIQEYAEHLIVDSYPTK